MPAWPESELYQASKFRKTVARSRRFYKDGGARFMADVREAPMRKDTEDPWALTERNGVCKLSAHAHRHGGSMGAYRTSQGGGAWGARPPSLGGVWGVPPCRYFASRCLGL